MVTCGLVYLGRKKATAKKTLFLTVYLFVLVNLMELVAYIYMRSFAQHGDTGIFTRGTGTPPWLFFLVGSALLTWALWILFTRAMPRLQKTIFPGQCLRTVDYFAAYLFYSVPLGQRNSGAGLCRRLLALVRSTRDYSLCRNADLVPSRPSFPSVKTPDRSLEPPVRTNGTAPPLPPFPPYARKKNQTSFH